MKENLIWIVILYLLFLSDVIAIEYRLRRIERKAMRTRQELDTVIAGLPRSIEEAVDDALSPIIQSLIDKLAQGADFTSEIAQLEGVGSEVANKVKEDLTPKE